MQYIRYSIQDGFTNVDCEPWDDWDAFREELLGRNSGPNIERVGSNPESEFGTYTYISNQIDENKGKYYALVEVVLPDFSCHAILVSTPADLFHLRLTLQPLFQNEALHRLDTLITAAEKMFHAHHGHYVDQVCWDCDPIEKRSRDEHTRKMEKSIAERRKAVAEQKLAEQKAETPQC